MKSASIALVLLLFATSVCRELSRSYAWLKV
jgi:hypothetical protein